MILNQPFHLPSKHKVTMFVLGLPIVYWSIHFCLALILKMRNECAFTVWIAHFGWQWMLQKSWLSMKPLICSMLYFFDDIIWNMRYILFFKLFEKTKSFLLNSSSPPQKKSIFQAKRWNCTTRQSSFNIMCWCIVQASFCALSLDYNSS